MRSTVIIAVVLLAVGIQSYVHNKIKIDLFEKEQGSQSCPKGCSGNGVCNKGACECNPGWQLADCSYKCGNLGETCCSGSCLQGKCVAFDTWVSGVCTNYGGSYGTTTGGSCSSPNPFLDPVKCACPPGFGPECVQISSSSIMCSCVTSSYDRTFGGTFVQETNGQCAKANPFTKGCSCPSGTASTYGVPASSSSVLHICSFTANSINQSDVSTFSGWFDISTSGKCHIGSQPPVGNGQCNCGVLTRDRASCSQAFAAGDGADATYVAVCNAQPGTGGLYASLSFAPVENLFVSKIKQAIANEQQIKIPPISGHDYKVEGIEFDSLSFSSITVTVPKVDELQISLSGGSMNGKIGRIDVKKGIVHTHCDAHPFDLKEISVTVTVAANLDFGSGTFDAAFAVASAQASLGEVDVDVHGNVICDLAKHTIEDQIKSAVKKAFPDQVTQNIVSALSPQLATVASTLNKLNFEFGISELPGLTVDGSLVGCGTFFNPSPSNFLSLVLRGSSYNTQTKLETPLLAGPFYDGSSTGVPHNQDIQVCVSQYVFGSLLWTMYNDALVDLTVTNSEIPSTSPIQLNTSSPLFATIAPNLTAIFPADLMQVVVTWAPSSIGANPPSVAIATSGKIHIELSLSTLFQVISWNAPAGQSCVYQSSSKTYLCDAFVLSWDTVIDIVPSIAESGSGIVLKASASFLNTTASTAFSRVGPVGSDMLNSLVPSLIPQALSELNSLLQEQKWTFTNSLDGVTILNLSSPIYTTISGEGAMCFNANVELSF